MDLDEYAEAIGAGSEEAFALWLARAERAIRASLRSFATNVDTEAVFQEACLRIWMAARWFVPGDRPNGLLRLAVTIARNLAKTEAVRRGREAPLPDDPTEIPDPATLVSPADPFLVRAVRKCIEKLPPRPRQAIGARLQNRGRLPDQALARSLNMRPNTFLQNVTRARRLLEECLQRAGIEVPR